MVTFRNRHFILGSATDWPKADIGIAGRECLLLDKSGHCGILAGKRLSAFDPKRTLDRKLARELQKAVFMGENVMRGRFAIVCAVIGVLGATTGSTVSTAVATDIIDEWANVKTPAAPEIKAVTLDPKTTALIVGDFMNQNCAKRPRCVAALPAVKKLLGEARAAKVTVIYSIIPNSTTADIITEVAPAADEPSVQSGLDKFYKTNLEQILKDKGIQTVILVGTSTEGLIIYTGGAAATRGFNVVVPIDGMASADAYAEQYGAWHMTHAPIVSSKVTLTRTGMIKF